MKRFISTVLGAVMLLGGCSVSFAADAPAPKEFHPGDKAVDVVLDTDAYNEIDDQYAISLLLASPERANMKAFYAAPFLNGKSTSAADGMEKSYNEILHLLELAKKTEYKDVTFRGSTEFMKDEKTPVMSDAAKDLAKRAMEYSKDKPLYVLAIGALTNVASAILINPDIVDRIVIVALNGHSQEWPDTKEFNMYQDVAAARVVFGCGAKLVQLPCMGVVEKLRTTKPELEFWLRGKNALSDYLIDHTIEEADSYAKGKPWSRPIWDVATVAWLLDTDNVLTKQRVIKTPIPGYDNKYEDKTYDHDMVYVWDINRDAVFETLFNKLANFK